MSSLFSFSGITKKEPTELEWLQLLLLWRHGRGVLRKVGSPYDLVVSH